MDAVIDPHLWLLFFLTFAATGIVPGPNVAYSVAQSLSFGFRRALPVPIGFALGTGGHAIIVFGGIGLLLQQVDFILEVIKWAGICFLIYLAWKSFNASGEQDFVDSQELTAKQMILGAILVSFTNPKGVIASIIIYPTFVSDQIPLAPQAVILGITGMILSFGIYLGYVFAASRVRVLFKNQAQISQFVGVVYLIIAVLLVFL